MYVLRFMSKNIKLRNVNNLSLLKFAAQLLKFNFTAVLRTKI